MKFYIQKLGCPKNDVDADYIAARLIEAGHSPVDKIEQAETVIVNTCGFIQSAKEESIDEILKIGQMKKDGLLKKVFASGCLSQRYGDELIKDISELDGAFGLGEWDSLSEAVASSGNTREIKKIESKHLSYLDSENRYISDKFPYTYIKISDGCNRRCTYCAIPDIRGNYHSRPIDSIINEVEFLAQNGKREFILVSQEATRYGFENGFNETLFELLDRLEEIDNVKWIRLMYLHPAQLDDRLIEKMANSSKILSYFDLPLQHINNDVLGLMNRQVDRKTIEKLISIVKSINNSTLRTTFIVGFPGETEKRFQELKKFIEDIEFDRMGIFTYSPEEGTKAEKLKEQIPEEVKLKRLDELMSVQQQIAFDKNNSLIGELKEVIIDRRDENGSWIGRTKGDCPDIDQEVFIEDDSLKAGNFYEIKIEKTDGYDLIGSKVRELK